MFDRHQGRFSHRQEQADEAGFTLIELLIVIVVLGILAAVTVFGLSNLAGQSATAACQADAKSVATAQEAFRAQNSSAPSGSGFAPNVAALVPRYLRSLPGTGGGKYTIATDTSGAVLVTKSNPAGSLPVNFDTTPTACDGL